jgi:hypothetical protein
MGIGENKDCTDYSKWFSYPAEHLIGRLYIYALVRKYDVASDPYRSKTWWYFKSKFSIDKYQT